MTTNKKNSLSVALHEASGKKNIPAATINDMPASAEQTELPPSRRGKKIISGYFDPAVARQLKQLALDSDASIQALLTEALNDLFVKYNKKPLA